MSDAIKPPSSSTKPSRGSGSGGRGKSRGGLGKYLRARGRGRGLGRPAEFGKRLVLEGEELFEGEEAEAQAAEISKKYSKRRLETNANRYVEPEAELDSDGEVKREPEVDLSSFLERQRITEAPSGMFASSSRQIDDEEEVDDTITPILSNVALDLKNAKKGQVQQIQWDEELEEMSREKATTEAARDLKARFRAKSAYLVADVKNSSRNTHRERRQERDLVNAPPLDDGSLLRDGTEKKEMQDFLDDLLG